MLSPVKMSNFHESQISQWLESKGCLENHTFEKAESECRATQSNLICDLLNQREATGRFTDCNSDSVQSLALTTVLETTASSNHVLAQYCKEIPLAMPSADNVSRHMKHVFQMSGVKSFFSKLDQDVLSTLDSRSGWVRETPDLSLFGMTMHEASVNDKQRAFEIFHGEVTPDICKLSQQDGISDMLRCSDLLSRAMSECGISPYHVCVLEKGTTDVKRHLHVLFLPCLPSTFCTGVSLTGILSPVSTEISDKKMSVFGSSGKLRAPFCHPLDFAEMQRKGLYSHLKTIAELHLKCQLAKRILTLKGPDTEEVRALIRRQHGRRLVSEQALQQYCSSLWNLVPSHLKRSIEQSVRDGMKTLHIKNESASHESCTLHKNICFHKLTLTSNLKATARLPPGISDTEDVVSIDNPWTLFSHGLTVCKQKFDI